MKNDESDAGIPSAFPNKIPIAKGIVNRINGALLHTLVM